MSDNISKAVELADGWTMHHDGSYNSPMNKMTPYMLGAIPQGYKDALAAQLVRQVDALENAWLEFSPLGAVWVFRGDGDHALAIADDSDRTDNTINAIVESGVLELKENDGEGDKRCKPCRATGLIHCAHPNECGGPWTDCAEQAIKENEGE